MKKLIMAMILLGTAAGARAETTDKPYLRVTGEASLAAKPDQAQVEIGVISQKPTAQEAAAENAKQLEAVLAKLKKLLGEKADLKTVNYNLHPVYGEARPGKGPVITGYSANNTVRVTVTDLAKVGPVVDMAAGSGANSIQQVLFTLKEEDDVRSKALAEAVKKARAKAAVLSEAAGRKILRVHSVEESGADAGPVFLRSAKMTDAATRMEPGHVDVRASVTVTYELAP